MAILDRPEAGDPILQKWAAELVRVLRRHKLVDSNWFKVKTTEKGTIVTFKNIRKKKKIRIKFGGIPSQFMICRKDGGESYPPRGGQLHDLPVEVWPLGYSFANIVPAGTLTKSELYVNEMIDGEPYFDNDFILGSNNELVIEITIEVEE